MLFFSLKLIFQIVERQKGALRETQHTSLCIFQRAVIYIFNIILLFKLKTLIYILLMTVTKMISQKLAVYFGPYILMVVRLNPESLSK